MKYATQYTDKFYSAKARTFDNYEELRKYLVSEVVAANTNKMKLGELIKAYNAQHGDLIELRYAVYINTKGEVIYA